MTETQNVKSSELIHFTDEEPEGYRGERWIPGHAIPGSSGKNPVFLMLSHSIPHFLSVVQISYIFPRPINNSNSSAPFQNHWNLIRMSFLHWRKSENTNSGREERRGRTVLSQPRPLHGQHSESQVSVIFPFSVLFLLGILKLNFFLSVTYFVFLFKKTCIIMN